MVYSRGRGSLAPSWLELEKAYGGRVTAKGTPDEMKAQYAAMYHALGLQRPKPSENVEISDGDVDGIRYRLYTPKGTKGGLPVAIWSQTFYLRLNWEVPER